jgi:tetratricopeptide (TPR) repeat protein
MCAEAFTGERSLGKFAAAVLARNGIEYLPNMKLRDEWKWIVPLVGVCVVVYANSLTGTFVYDDLRQILRNPLIQDNSLIWKALTSDVWAFKGDGTVAASNYWRPTFTAWHIINFRLFGTDPLGWHFTNLLLHSGVCIMAYALLRRWAFPAAVAFTITIIFAVHPAHVESVAWISGSPDMLFALAFLGSLWFAQTFAESGLTEHIVLALLFYATALGAKEIGIVCLPIYYFVLKGDKASEKRAGAANTPMLLLGMVAAAYFLIRWSVIGAISRPPEGAVWLGAAILSTPSMFAFYLRQMFFPYWVGANYPLEPVSQIGMGNFVVPLIVSIAALAAIFHLAKSTERGKLAAALFLLPLATAMNATAFIPEQIVHDRYLYLPLLGMLMLVVPFAAKFVREKQLVITSVVVSAALSVQTFAYNRAWTSDLSLWSWTRSIDNSSFTSMQWASELAESGRLDEAIAAYTDAIKKRPTARGYLGRGRVLLKKRQYQDAERDLMAVIQDPPEKSEAYALYQTYEALGIVYSEQRNYDAAARNFVAARQALPIYSAALTVNLAIVLYQIGRKDEALRELESAKAQARKELLPESKSVFFRLGMLYAELGRRDEARAALREYLALTSSTTVKATLDERTQAGKLLESLK